MLHPNFRPAVARLVIVSALVASFTFPAGAATLVVDTLDDNQGAVDACSLRAAIINANNDDQSGSSNCQPGSGFDSITFEAELAGGAIEMNGTAFPTISDSLTIQGPEADDASGLTIDARGLSRIMKLSEAEPTTLVMNSVTLTGGRTSLDGVQDGAGAALQAFADELDSPHVVLLNHVRMTANSTSGENAAGAAIMVVHVTLTMDDTEISGNWTEGEYAPGGGLAAGRDSVLAMFDSRVVNNTVEGDFSMGGGILGFASRVEATDSEISGNRTLGGRGMGGGILLDSGGDLQLTRSTLENNSTLGPSGSGGGAMVLGTVTLMESRVSGNQTGGHTSLGGGIAVGRPPTPSFSNHEIEPPLGRRGLGNRGTIPLDEVRLTAINSIVSGNSTAGPASHGGGILVHEANVEVDGVQQHFPGVLELENSTVAGNSTAGEASMGGGIAIANSGPGVGTTKLQNSTVSANATTGNDSSGGGMVVSLADLSLVHSTLAFNQSNAGVDGIEFFDYSGTDIELINSMIVQSGASEEACSQSATLASNALATDTGCTGSATDAADIALQPLADEGGPTPTHAPSASSTAINAAGDCVEELSITHDQRGQPRPGGQSITCDIGAFERQDTQSNDTIFADRFQTD